MAAMGVRPEVPSVVVPSAMSAVFTEDWFGEASCRELANLYYRTERLSGTVVEVGSWEGKSTCTLANACHPVIVRAVDTWNGSPGEISEQLAAERDVFDRFKKNVTILTRGNVWIYRMGWRTYFETHRAKVKFCFIDATHTYGEVRDNIEAVLPLMVEGGIVCGDDVHHPPVLQAVMDTLGGDTQVAATLWWKQC